MNQSESTENGWKGRCKYSSNTTVICIFIINKDSEKTQIRWFFQMKLWWNRGAGQWGKGFKRMNVYLYSSVHRLIAEGLSGLGFINCQSNIQNLGIMIHQNKLKRLNRFGSPFMLRMHYFIMMFDCGSWKWHAKCALWCALIPSGFFFSFLLYIISKYFKKLYQNGSMARYPLRSKDRNC